VALKHQAHLQLIRIYAGAGDILAWGQRLFPDKFPLPFCAEMHEYFVQIRKDPYTVTEAPRNHAKTTIKCFLIPIFQSLVEPESFRFYLNVQATDKKALAINRAIMAELESNEDLRALYGDQVSYRWTAEEFILNNGTIFKAVSTGQSIRGIHYRNRRPSYIIADDLYDQDDINNPDSTIKKNDWFWGTLYPARAKGIPVSFTKSWERTYYWLGRKENETVQFPLRTYKSELVSYYNLALASDSLVLGYLALYKILEFFYTSVSEDALHQKIKDQLVAPDFAHTKPKKTSRTGQGDTKLRHTA